MLTRVRCHRWLHLRRDMLMVLVRCGDMRCDGAEARVSSPPRLRRLWRVGYTYPHLSCTYPSTHPLCLFISPDLFLSFLRFFSPSLLCPVALPLTLILILSSDTAIPIPIQFLRPRPSSSGSSPETNETTAPAATPRRRRNAEARGVVCRCAVGKLDIARGYFGELDDALKADEKEKGKVQKMKEKEALDGDELSGEHAGQAVWEAYEVGARGWEGMWKESRKEGKEAGGER
ncbi:hypothetical protein R3P38DRAFT_1192917 [Favolaschia claudopus]|uniref:Uncharacterized protein n=1 Tax=Favolaschia claudopus TaxID=2862362 RepID=A0AAW0DZX5_9AGAR